MSECHFEPSGSIYKPVENEDVFFMDTKGNDEDVTSVAAVIDGADGRKKRILPNGEEVVLPEIVSGEKTAARVWADLLKNGISQLVMDGQKTLKNVVFEATKKASEEFSHVAGTNLPKEIDPLQIPAASVLVARVNNNKFEAFSSGDCGMIVRYQDGSVETFLGSEYLKRMRVERDALILREHPDFNEKSPAEQAKIRYLYMQQTKESLGKKYYTPYLGGADNMKYFDRVSRIFRNKNRNLSIHSDDMMWSFEAPVVAVQSVALFSSGIEPAFKDKEIAKEFIAEPNRSDAMKILDYLSALNAILNTNQHAIAVQSVNNDKVQKVALADRTALLFNLIDEYTLARG